MVMDDSNASKEKIKTLSKELKVEGLLMVQKDDQLQANNQKIKSMAAKVVPAFQLIDEYNTILFSWYHKGFKLLRNYLVKHSLEVDLENLYFESIDKEMEANEAAQAVASTNENPVELEGEVLRPDGSEAPVA